MIFKEFSVSVQKQQTGFLDFQKKANFLSVFSFMFFRLNSPNSWLTSESILLIKDNFALTNERKYRWKINYDKKNK